VNRKSGFVYERRLVEQHLAVHGTDPGSGEPCAAADLVPLRGAALARPRPVAAASVSGLLGALQNEWDGLMLEQFQLRQALEATRLELSNSLYQHDAACRVIARVVKERDAARASLTAAQSALAQRAGSAAAAGRTAPDEDMGEGGAGAGVASSIPEEVIAAAKDKQKELTKMRKAKNKAMADDRTTAEALHGGFRGGAASHSPHGPAASGGISALAPHPSAARHPSVVLSGGGDKTALVFDVARGEALARLGGAGGHSKRVTAVAFHALRDSVCVTGSADGTVKVWAPASGGENGAVGSFSAAYADIASLKPHDGGRGEVVGLSAHPVGDYVLSAGHDASWSLSDIAVGRVVSSVTGCGAAFRCMQLHPDGLLAAMGTAGREVRLYDLRSGESVATFEGHSSGVGSVAFSESGIALASGADDGARIWDLRKSKCVRAFSGAGGSACSSLAFDSSGILLACGSASGAVAVYDARALGAEAEGAVAPLCSLNAHKSPVAALTWTARALVSAGLDGVLSSHTV